MVDWSTINTVLLDMDGTLLDLHFDNHFWLDFLPRAYARHHGLTETDAREYLFSEFRTHQGSLNWYCLEFWSDRLQMDIVGLKQHLTHKIVFRPNAEQFLEQLQRSGKQRILVTNAHRQSLDLKLQHTRLGELLDQMVSSHDYRYPKEDPRFWQHLINNQGINPTECLLIDDSAPVLRTAAEFGIRQLLRIRQPDSTQTGIDDNEFPLLHCFTDILPTAHRHD